VSVRSHVVRLEAEVSKYVTGMVKSEKATKDVTDAAEELGKAVDDVFKDLDVAKPAKELAELAAAHQKAAKAVGMQYDAQGNLIDANGRLVSSNRAAAHGLDAFSEAVYKTEYAVEQAAEAQKRAAANAEKLGEKQRAAGEKVGLSLLGIGTATVAGLGASAKAAMDWETAWTGVTKTVDGTPEQMAGLESGIRGLAKSLPLAHTEIAAVAEAAGQLGVKRQDIVGFTKTMIDLGESTNLTADEAATNIAQISNVMGTMAREGSLGVSRFGAALVALGNDGASTEAEILSMAQRIAGAGATVGASESEVLALSNTLASMGVKAELGGGVTTRVLLKMYAAVQDGGEGLAAFAKVAGTTGPAFEKAFGESPVRALSMVSQGLARVKAEGGNVVQAMKDMEIKGTEEYQVMLALAASGDLLTKSLDLGARAWEENTALANEAAKRYETTESKVKIAWNNIKDAAIDAGAATLPVIQGLAEGVSGLAQTFGSLPQPVQGAVTVLAVVTGTVGLLAGGLLTVIPKIHETRTAFKDLTASGSKAPGVLLGIGKAAGIAAAAYTAMATAAALASAATEGNRGKTSVEDFNNALVGVSTNGDKAKKSLDGAFQGVLKLDEGIMNISGGTTEVNSFGDALDRVFHTSWQDNLSDFGGTLFGQNATTGINTAKDAISNYDKSLASLAKSGNIRDAAAGFKLAAEEAQRNGDSLDSLVELFPEYKDAVLAAKTANGETQVSQEDLIKAMLDADPAAQDAAKAQEVLKGALDETGVGLDAVIEDMDKFLEQLFASGQITMSAREANAAYNDALRGIPEAMAEIAKSEGKMGRILNDTASDFDLTTEAGARANSAFQNIAQRGMAEVEAKALEGLGQEELQAKLNTTYEDLVKSADQMGIHGQAAIDLARDVLGIPDGVDIHTWMADTARVEAGKTQAAVDAIKDKTVTVTLIRQEIVQASIEEKNVDEAFLNDVRSRATGGAVVGPGTGTSDEAGLYRLSNGEHVLTAAEVEKMGGQGAVYQFRSNLRAGDIPGKATGGAIGAAGAIAAPSSFGGGSSTNVSLAFTVQGEANPRETVQMLMGEVKYELSKAGVKLGGR
jgi:TP901 family phage tail tape measure protein